jgi:hypothetical protein
MFKQHVTRFTRSNIPDCDLPIVAASDQHLAVRAKSQGANSRLVALASVQQAKVVTTPEINRPSQSHASQVLPMWTKSQSVNPMKVALQPLCLQPILHIPDTYRLIVAAANQIASIRHIS